MLADAGSTPAASTISYNVVDQHRPHNPKKSLGFYGLPQFCLLVLNSPNPPMFGHTVGTRPYISSLFIHISTWNVETRRVYFGIPCGYVGKCQPLEVNSNKEREKVAGAVRRPLPRSSQLLCLCLVIQAQSLMGGTNAPQKEKRKP